MSQAMNGWTRRGTSILWNFLGDEKEWLILTTWVNPPREEFTHRKNTVIRFHLSKAIKEGKSTSQWQIHIGGFPGLCEVGEKLTAGKQKGTFWADVTVVYFDCAGCINVAVHLSNLWTWMLKIHEVFSYLNFLMNIHFYATQCDISTYVYSIHHSSQATSLSISLSFLCG